LAVGTQGSAPRLGNAPHARFVDHDFDALLRLSFLFPRLPSSSMLRLMKRHAPAADRNKEAILGVIREFLTNPSFVLTIAEGSGQHVVHFAKHLPHVTFLPTDADAEALASIDEYVNEALCKNVRPAKVLDVTSAEWPVEQADLVTCINMIHISPWSATEGLFRGAARILPPGGFLITYGPYRFSGDFGAASNKAFDESLRSRNPEWGVRDVDDLEKVAASCGMMLEGTMPMPANNHCLVFNKEE
jgi:SAM-dependent methyltransferase